MNKIIAGRIANLNITEGERAQALGYLATGEAIANAIYAILSFFKSSSSATPTLKHSH